MVVFTCSACGESLKKKDVEKHYFTKCRDCNLLTCIDCNKDFWGDAYKEHIKCVTEAERYGGKDFKAPVFKGEAKQQEWIDLLSNITSTRDVSPRVREVFQKMQAFNNIPRKEKPFKNFLGSSMGVRNPSLAEEVWKTIQEALQSAQKSKPGNSGKQQPPQQGQDKNENSTGGEKPQNNGADEEKGEQAQQQQPKKRKSDGAESQLPAKKKQHHQENGVNQSSAPEEGDAPSEEATEGKQAQQQQPKKRKSDGAKSQLPAKKKKHCQENGVGQGSAPEEGDAPSEKATEGKQAQQQQPKKRKSDGAESQLPAKKKHCQENGVGQGSAPEEDQAAKKPKLQKENKDDAAEEAEDEQESVKKARFKWKKTIKEALLNAENCQMSMNLLKKTVFDKYRNQGGLLSEEDVQTKFDKVLSNQRYFEHKGGKVRYVKS